MESILAFEGVCAGYGRVQILKDLSFEVKKGEVFGIIGPNGSGKSTMLNALTGMIPLSKGKILFEGRSLGRLLPDQRCRLGLGRTFQIPRPFVRLSVYENVLAASVFGKGKSERDGKVPALDILQVTGLFPLRNTLAGELTLLDRKRLEIARAMATEPKLLLLDEVAAGLNSAEVEEVMDIVSYLRGLRVTIIWIEHNLEMMRRSTDRLLCMAEGRNAICGEPSFVMESEIVEELYLGRDEQGAGASDRRA